MKIRIDVDDSVEEPEVTIRCNRIDGTIQNLQNVISDTMGKNRNMVLYKDDREYFLPIDKLIFFETSEEGVCAHTVDEMFQTKYKLYELEEILPGSFARVSKSTIVNTDCIYSITKNLTSSCVLEFDHSHKEVYVSRYYYKALKIKLDEKRKG